MGGAGASAGTGAGNAEKDTLPQAVEWGGAGKRAAGPRFSASRLPRNELYRRHPNIFLSLRHNHATHPFQGLSHYLWLRLLNPPR